MTLQYLCRYQMKKYLKVVSLVQLGGFVGWIDDPLEER